MLKSKQSVEQTEYGAVLKGYKPVPEEDRTNYNKYQTPKGTFTVHPDGSVTDNRTGYTAPAYKGDVE